MKLDTTTFAVECEGVIIDPGRIRIDFDDQLKRTSVAADGSYLTDIPVRSVATVTVVLGVDSIKVEFGEDK